MTERGHSLWERQQLPFKKLRYLVLCTLNVTFMLYQYGTFALHLCTDLSACSIAFVHLFSCSIACNYI